MIWLGSSDQYLNSLNDWTEGQPALTNGKQP